MTILLYNEWIKFKKTSLVFWSLLIVCMPLLIGLALVVVMDVPNKMDGLKFINAILWIHVRFTTLCLFTYVASTLMAMEFKTEVLKIQWTTPVSKTLFFFCKIIFLSLWSVVVTLLSFLMTLIFISLVVQDFNLFDVLLDSFFFFMVSSILTWPFMYFSVLLVLIFKKTWSVMVINMLLFILTLLLTSFSWSSVNPWLSPTWIIFSFSRAGNQSSYLSLIIFTAVVVFLGHQLIHKVEV